MKRALTLLELVVGIAILLIVGGFSTSRVYRMIEKKRFNSDLEKLAVRLSHCHALAVNMQSDWSAILEKKEGGWVFYAFSLEQPKGPKIAPFSLPPFELLVEDKKVEKITFDFSSTGLIEPAGKLKFQPKKGGAVEWDLSEIFQKEEGNPKTKDLGPLHPKYISL